MIIDETPGFVVLNKPAGITFQGEENSLLSQLKQQLGMDLFPVHRLDKMTSGLVVVAKTEQANKALSQQFAERKISKLYLALANSKPNKKQGLVAGDLLKARNGCWKLSRAKNNPSVTQFFSFPAENSIRLFALKPHSGKTHQLRVVMRSVGAPIIGDERYGGSVGERGYLHAYQLAFAYEGNDYCWQVLPEVGELWPQALFEKESSLLAEVGSLQWPLLPSGLR